MTKRNVLGMCLIVLVILADLWLVDDMKFEQEKMQKTIDVQKEMIYNRDRQIEEKNIRIEGLNQEVFDLRRELEEKEASRGAIRVVTCEVSAYTHGDGMTPSLVMANGESVHVGAVACNFLPFGTKVRINGEIFVVKDRCGVDNCMDIYMESHSECMEWGRKVMEVEIL